MSFVMKWQPVFWEYKVIVWRKLLALWELELEPEVVLFELLRINYIQQLDNGNFVLSRDLNRETFYDFIKSMPWKLPSQLELDRGSFSVLKPLLSRLKAHDESLQKVFSVTLRDCYSND